jgi:hypothetical protein
MTIVSFLLIAYRELRADVTRVTNNCPFQHSKPHAEEQRRTMIYARATIKLSLGVTAGTVNVTVPSYNEKPCASGVSKSKHDA